MCAVFVLKCVTIQNVEIIATFDTKVKQARTFQAGFQSFYRMVRRFLLSQA